MSDDEQTPRIKAFVGRSFAAEDESVWVEFRKILDALRPIGFVYEDAKQAQPRSVSEKVRHGIEESNLYVEILTRRFVIVPGTPPWKRSLFQRLFAAFRPLDPSPTWVTSEWIVQEAGYALGRGKGRVMLVEEGVNVPTSDLDSDREWIQFRRDSVPACAPSVVAIITNILADLLPVPVGPPPSTIDLPQPTQEEKPTAEAKPAPGFNEVIAALDKRDFSRARELFDAAFGKGQGIDPLTSWMGLYFLRLASVHGDTESLGTLSNIVTQEPDNVDARVELARYYQALDSHAHAVKVLLEGIAVVSARFRGRMIREAARAVGTQGDPNRAILMMRDSWPLLADPAEIKASLVSLADIAKTAVRQDVEASALECVLDIEPGDLWLRFRLAYLYSTLGNHRMAAYHYAVRLAQGQDSTARNNLGVALSGLEMPGRAIEMYDRAAVDSPIAKANLSDAYVNGGFLPRGKGLAGEVLAEKGTDQEHARARAVLGRIENQTRSESEKHEVVIGEARKEREFRARWAIALLTPGGAKATGVFETRYGMMTVLEEEGHLFGEAERVETLSPVSLLGPASWPVARKVTRTWKVSLEASVEGRAGKFKLKTSSEEGEHAPGARESTVEGLMIIGVGGEELELMVEDGQMITVSRAVRVGPLRALGAGGAEPGN